MIPGAHIFRIRAAIGAASLALLLGPCALYAIQPVEIGGAIEGRVSDTAGTPQMGAAVQVFDHQDRFVSRISTDDQGLFTIAGLLPDVYSIRVSLATFLPAFRSHIVVEPGASSLLDISLSGLFSVIRVLPPSVGKGAVSDDWKWVLRSASSTRPIFRYTSDPASPREPVFSGSEGLVRLSAGDISSAAGEVGTAFAFATNVLGSNNVQFAGDVGYGASSDSPSASIRTTYRRNTGDMPEISFTARQLEIPRWSGAYSAEVPGEPPLRTLGASIADKTQLSDSLELAYGAGFDSVSFVEHRHYYSPYARLTWEAPIGVVELTFTSGNARPELGMTSTNSENPDLQSDVLALNGAPAVTVEDGHMRVQQGQDLELAWSHALGSNRLGAAEVRITGYRESVQNAALLISGSPGSSFSSDLVPDLYTDSLLFDSGNYHTMGFTAAVTQHIGDHYKITVTYGTLGVLTTRNQQLETASPDELRALIGAGERQAITAVASATVPRAGTHFDASYQFMNDHDAMTAREYSTDANQTQAGLNFSVRQPIPAILGLPFRMEADAELRNLLADGYLPLSTAGGQRLYLVHNPRIVRGGLNFRF